MAIIRMTVNYTIVFENNSVERLSKETFPDGAYCPFEYNDTPERRTFEGAIVLYSTHHGLCLFEREENGRDDSDFYMTVWNPELRRTEEILFATTRGWTYPCYGSSADASPEVRAEYDAWVLENQRRAKILARWNHRKLRRQCAKACGLTTMQYDRVMNCYPSAEIRQRIFKLLSTELRSNFRIKLATQIRAWLDDVAPKYNTPLSAKQLMYV